MSEYQPLELKGFYRAYSHMPVWAIVEEAGIWEQVAIKASFEFCDSSTEAEQALYSGSIARFHPRVRLGARQARSLRFRLSAPRAHADDIQGRSFALGIRWSTKRAGR